MFDAHCHLDSLKFGESLETYLNEARQLGINGFICAGYDARGWKAQRALEKKHPDLHNAFGCHPWSLKRERLSDDLADLGQCVFEAIDNLERVVAIGETGLDYHRATDVGDRRLQKLAFLRHIALAKALDLPLILHIVKAHQDALDILKGEGLPRRGAMVHSFSGSKDVAKAYVKLGLHLSFSGQITNPKAKKVREAIQSIPRDRLMIETDAPDQTPIQFRPAINTPANLLLIAKVAAELRQEDPFELNVFTEQNTRRFFDI